MADDSQFVPDDMDDYGEVDPDAYLEMQAEMDDLESQQQIETSGIGQSAPRKLDFAGFSATTSFSDPLQPGAAESGTAPLSASELQLRLSTGSQLPRPPAASVPAGALSHFERERQAQLREDEHAPQRPQPSASSLFPSPAVLPPLMRSVSELRQRVLDDDRSYVFRRAPVAGDFLPVTNAKGERVFLTVSSEEEASKKLLAHMRAHRSEQMHRDLGQVNVRQLLRDLDEESTAAALKASLAEAKAREWDSDDEDDERTKLRKRRQRKERLIARLDREAAEQALAAKNSQLWVDKYTPKGYADLLSPEHINRDVLEWIHGWDTCVFGAKKSAQDAVNPRTLDNHMLHSNLLAASAKKSKKTAASVLAADGETDIRPEFKVLLLCGAPGLGKTTLAHILARQAGYATVEINASDDRSSSVLESKIRNATEMQSVSFGGNHQAKPNCVILDEIDGVANETGGSDAISMLLKLVQAEAKPKHGKHGKKDESKEESGAGGDDESDAEEEVPAADAGGESTTRKISKRGAGGERKADKPGPLKRPIICICNDQYAAALRPLRAVARVFEFSAAPKGKFVDRLKYIARNEGMDVDTRTLSALADIVDCDIRSALNTLQFVHSKGQRLTAASLNSLAVGRKDVEKSRLQVWEAVFCDKEIKKDNLLRFKDMRETEQHNSRAPVAVMATAKESKSKELHGLLSDSGDLDKVLEGVFHNYPSIGYPDPSLNKTVDCAEWMVFADLLQQRIQSELDMSLSGYVPYAALGIHQLTSRPRKVKVDFPSMYYHQYVASVRNGNILRSFLSPTCCFTIQGTTQNATVMDVVPHVLDILHPSIRAVNLQLLTSKEKAELHNLIDTMLSMSLTYRAEVVSAFGQPFVPAWKQVGSSAADASNVAYKLEPAIDQLSVWSNPMDPSTARAWEPPNKMGDKFKSKFGTPFGAPPAPSNPTTATSSFIIDKRDVNMPNKVKREVLRELEFETMRRAEAARSARFQEEQSAAAGTDAAGADTPAEPASLLSPAVQRLLDAEKKRARPADAATPPKAATAAAAAALEDDISPATKRAKHSASLNFLNQHADAARNSKARNRGRAPAAAKLELAGLQTERESKQAAAAGDMGPPAAVVPHVRAVHPLHYKFNDGCTNAVRRTIPVEHFLPL